MFSTLSTPAECELESEKPGSRHQAYPSLANTPVNMFPHSSNPSPANVFGGWPSPILAAMARNFSGGLDAASSSTPNSGVSAQAASSNAGAAAGVFPPAMAQLQANFQQYYANLMHQLPGGLFQQQQLMQHFMAASNGQKYGPATSSSIELNGSIGGTSSESRASSTSDSTTAAATATDNTNGSSKKLQIDSEGNATCPVCEEKIGSNSAQWSAHVQVEKDRLIKSIEKLKSQRNSLQESGQKNNGLSPTVVNSTGFVASGHEAMRKKRDFELTRIRNNQQKRMQMKSLLAVNPSIRNNVGRTDKTESSFAMESTKDSAGKTTHQSQGSRLDVALDKSFCKGCERHYEFLVISAGMGEETRCFSCFEQYRRQVGALPLTITESPVEDTRNGSDLLSNGSSFPKSQSPSNGIEQEVQAQANQKNNGELTGLLKLKFKNGSLVRDESMDGFELTTAPPQKRARLVKEESEESVDI